MHQAVSVQQSAYGDDHVFRHREVDSQCSPIPSSHGRQSTPTSPGWCGLGREAAGLTRVAQSHADQIIRLLIGLSTGQSRCSINLSPHIFAICLQRELPWGNEPPDHGASAHCHVQLFVLIGLLDPVGAYSVRLVKLRRVV